MKLPAAIGDQDVYFADLRLSVFGGGFDGSAIYGHHAGCECGDATNAGFLHRRTWSGSGRRPTMKKARRGPAK
jgi:hypothetical protein